MGPAVACDGLTKHFGAVHAVEDLSFTVEPGEVVGFLGPNGAGKTTTIRMLLDLIRPTSGRVEVLGTDPREGGAEFRRRIGYVAGDLAMYNRLTGRQLLEFLAALRGDAEPCAGRGAGRAPRRRARPPDRDALARQPAEDRRRAGVRARARAARARRADERPRSRLAAHVSRARARSHRPRRGGVAVVARALRGAAGRRSGRDRARGPVGDDRADARSRGEGVARRRDPFRRVR